MMSNKISIGENAAVKKGLPVTLLLGLCLSGLAPGCSGSSNSSVSSSTTGSAGSNSGTGNSGGGSTSVTGKVVGVVSTTTAARQVKASTTATVAVQGTTISAAVQPDGTFELDGVPPGNQAITADNGSGTQGAVVVVPVTPGGTAIAGVLDLGPVGTLSGTVVSTSGNAPLGGSVVVATPAQSVGEALTDLPNGCPSFIAFTDSSGNYSLQDLPPGSYLVTANDQGFTGGTQTVTVAATVTTSASFTLAPLSATSGTVSGTLTTTVNGVSVPVRDALVYLDTSADPGLPVAPPLPGTAAPDSSGSSSTTGGGTVSSTGSSPGVGQLTISQVASSLPAIIVGPPVPSPSPSTQPFFAFTDPNGNFQLNGVPSGTYTLLASKLGYTAISQSVTVQTNETTTVALTLVSNSGQIVGTVTDASSGQPLANAGVVIDQSGDIFGGGGGSSVGVTGTSVPPITSTGGVGTVVNPGGTDSSVSVATTGTTGVSVGSSGSSGGGSGSTGIAFVPPWRGFAVTDSQGNYQIPAVLAGSYTVTAFDFNYADQSQTTTVSVGASSTVDFQLSVGGVLGTSVTGTVVGTTTGTSTGTSGSTGTTSGSSSGTGGTGAVPVTATSGSGSAATGSFSLGATFGSLLSGLRSSTP